MGDRGPTPTRERLWITKFDHSTDPPTPVEEVFVENGERISARAIGPESCAKCGEAHAPHAISAGAATRRYCTPCWTGGVARAFFEGLQRPSQEKETDERRSEKPDAAE